MFFAKVLRCSCPFWEFCLEFSEWITGRMIDDSGKLFSRDKLLAFYRLRSSIFCSRLLVGWIILCCLSHSSITLSPFPAHRRKLTAFGGFMTIRILRGDFFTRCWPGRSEKLNPKSFFSFSDSRDVLNQSDLGSFEPFHGCWSRKWLTFEGTFTARFHLCIVQFQK